MADICLKRPSFSNSNDPDCKRPRATPYSTEGSVKMKCCLKGCGMNVVIDPQTHCRVEIKAGLPATDLTQFHKQAAVIWSSSGEAVFHEECWQRLLKDTRRRKKSCDAIPVSAIEKTLIKDAAKTVERHDSTAELTLTASKIALLMSKAKHCVVFTGAGISTSAGIGDYRGKGGKWTEMDREAVTKEVSALIGGSASEEGEEPEESRDEIAYEDLRPTYTHNALAKLMELGIVKYIISQNCDNLHGLSGVDYKYLAELHGNVFLEICEECGQRYYRPYYVMDDLASQYYEELQDEGHTKLRKPRHALKCKSCQLNHRTGRRCEAKGCKGFLKDSIINFGDYLEEEILGAAEEQAKQADLIVSLGTTMRVTPACNLVLMGKKPLRLVIVNRQTTGFDDVCGAVGEDGEGLGVRVFGDCDRVMRQVMQILVSDSSSQL